MKKCRYPNKNFILVLRVILSSFMIWAFLQYLKLPKIISYFKTKEMSEPIEEKELSNLIRIIDKVARFKFFLIRNNCLKKSLLFYYWLLKSGAKGIELKIGVSMKGKKLSAHAWLTKDGQVFLDSPESVLAYHVTYTSGVINHEHTQT